MLKYAVITLLRNSGSRIWWKYFFVSDVISRTLFRENNGCYVLEEDWDYLIILDACRYDVFKEEIKNYDIKGELQYRVSRGAFTTQFLLENFRNVDSNLKKKLNDIIYITANPYVNSLFKDEFYKIIPVWDFGWDNSLKTVPPDVVYKVTIEAVRKYQDKRIIIHFIQPHEPFVSLGTQYTTGLNESRQKVLFNKMVNDTSVWGAVEKGYLKLEEVIKAYIENLRWVLPYAVKLCKILPGKTVITSDHGEAFGEKVHSLIPIRIYGHHNARIEPLIKVPWFISKESGSTDEVERELIKLKIPKLRTK